MNCKTCGVGLWAGEDVFCKTCTQTMREAVSAPVVEAVAPPVVRKVAPAKFTPKKATARKR